jgi:tetratricopeptide (TPR) repeat protein
MPSTAKTAAIILTLLALGFASVYALQARIDPQLRDLHQERDELLFQSGRLVRALSLEYQTLMAELYWTRVVQYYGQKQNEHDPNLELLAPLLHLTTELDPHLIVAYRFGGTFLAERPPQGAGRPDQGIELLRRGIAQNPDEWRLWSDLGFLYYMILKDYPKATEAFLEGSKNPKAREWMKVLAAKVAEEGQSRRVSQFLWQQVYDSTADPTIRKNALRHLEILKAEDDVEQLEKIAREFHGRFGRFPVSMNELVRAGMIRGDPVDPAGFPYVVEPEGKFQLNPASPIKPEAATAAHGVNVPNP